MAIQFLFAHAGESGGVSQAAVKPLLTYWYVALPLAVLVVLLASVVAYIISKRSKTVTYNVLLATLFLLGTASYTRSAIVSIGALSIGFALALLQVVFGLTSTVKKEKQV